MQVAYYSAREQYFVSRRGIILHKSGLISDYFSHIVTEDRKYFSDQK